MDKDPKVVRCIRLYRLFQAKVSLATREIERSFDIDRQTAIRDVRTLIEAGVPLEPQGAGANRRYALPEMYRRAGFTFTQGDAFALHLARRVLPFLRGTVIHEWLDQLRDKLTEGAPEITTEREARFARRLVVLSDPYRTYDGHEDVLNTLVSALLADNRVELVYEGRSKSGVMLVEPLALVVFRRALYLLGRMEGEAQPVRFALERISTATRRGRFDYPEDFDAEAVFRDSYGIFELEGPPEEVRLRFGPAVAGLVRSRVYHPSQRFETLGGGGVDLVMTTGGRELLNLALEFGATVEVVAPTWLREQVRDAHIQAAANYGAPHEQV